MTKHKTLMYEIQAKYGGLTDADCQTIKEAMEFALASEFIREGISIYMGIENEAEKKECEEILFYAFAERCEIYNHGREMMYR